MGETRLTEKHALTQLKRDVDALKKKLDQPSAKTRELLLEMETLKDAIYELNTIFKQALKETKGEDLSGSIKSLQKESQRILDQNETIARGMVALSDMLESREEAHHGLPVHRTPQHKIGPPTMPGSRVAPRPISQKNPGSPPGGITIPPPPPPPASPARKRKGLFS